MRALAASYGDTVGDAFVAPAPPAKVSGSADGGAPPAPTPTDPAAARDALYTRVAAVADDLAARWRSELPILPFDTGAAAQAALDARNRRYAPSAVRSGGGGAAGVNTPGAPPVVVARLSDAEKAVEAFFARRLQPAVAAARDAGVAGGAKAAASYAKGLWDRLNGGGRRGVTPGGALAALPPLAGTKAARTAAAASLAADVAALERKLNDASKAREARLRSAPPRERAALAAELRALDDGVACLSRALALKSLRLEMEAVYGYLEDEALDVTSGSGADGENLIFRQGSSEELALLAAEFSLLDRALASALASIGEDGALVGVATSSSALDDALASLAREVPDLRTRLAIGDDAVFGGQGAAAMLSAARVKTAVAESTGKVVDGALFFVRGLRLLGSDVGSACGLFGRAAAGGSLRPREVAALRRTARDVATFVPFTAILITPLTPVGHVLVFSFLQRYFPGFFPSQFSSRRQELMMRYEDLKAQLTAAQETAVQEAEAAELAAAAAAVARLTAPKKQADAAALTPPKPTTTTRSSSARSEDSDADDTPAAAAVKSLEGLVAAAEEEVGASGTETE